MSDGAARQEPGPQGPPQPPRPPGAGASSPGSPAWPPLPASATAAWPPADSTGPRTSVLVVGAAVFLLIVGILTFGLGALASLVGGLIAAAGAREDGIGSFGAFGGLIAGLAVLVVLWGILEVVAAIGMFIHRGWGRALGMIVSVSGVAFTGIGLLGSVGDPDTTGGSLGVSLLLLAGYGFAALALVTGGEHFRRRG